ncbi:MAG: hypothetical protein HFE58_06275 [Firmicutes bacterium]|nr:hypothetical protein [Bacillota bacterium]
MFIYTQVISFSSLFF